MRAVGILFMPKPLFHLLGVPIGVDPDDLAGLAVDENPVFGVQRQALVDTGVTLHIVDELPHRPLVGGAGAENRGGVQRAGQHLALVLDEHQVLAQLSDLLGAGYFGIAEVELAGPNAGLDEVVLVLLQAKNLVAEPVNYLHRAGGQQAIIQTAELQHGDGNLDDPGLRNLEETLLADSRA